MSGSLVFGRTLSCIKSRILTKESFNSCVSLSASRYFSVTPRKNMKLVQFTYKNTPGVLRVGYVEDDGVVDLNKVDNTLPNSLLGILKNGDLDKIKQIKSKNTAPVSLSEVRLEAPITGQDKVLCIGLNYMDHCQEQNKQPPDVPMMFSKFTSSVIGPEDAVKLRTDVTRKVDWEVELVVVISKEASYVKSADAFNYILGYTIAQDISARDWQKDRNAGQFLLGKSMDTFCPLGPWIVTSDEIGDAQKLDISCSVNGELKQKSNTCQLVHKIPDVIERLTSVMTLYPGDIILTGTPGGVGLYLNPPQFLKPGDVIHSTIQKIGTLQTRVEQYVKPC